MLRRTYTYLCKYGDCNPYDGQCKCPPGWGGQDCLTPRERRDYFANQPLRDTDLHLQQNVGPWRTVTRDILGRRTRLVNVTMGGEELIVMVSTPCHSYRLAPGLKGPGPFSLQDRPGLPRFPPTRRSSAQRRRGLCEQYDVLHRRSDGSLQLPNVRRYKYVPLGQSHESGSVTWRTFSR